MKKNRWQDDYDWIEAFKYADNMRSSYDTTCEPFTIDDVKTVLAMEEGENDGAQWIMIGQLKDGRYFRLSAGCDYTGWDCQAGGDSAVANTYENLIRFCMSENERTRLKIELEHVEDSNFVPTTSFMKVPRTPIKNYSIKFCNHHDLGDVFVTLNALNLSITEEHPQFEDMKKRSLLTEIK